MHPSYGPRMDLDGGSYFPPPYSLDAMSSSLQGGLVVLGLLAMCSLGATIVLIAFLCHYLRSQQKQGGLRAQSFQYIILVLNLLVADLQQCSAFVISFHWARLGRILAPSAPCSLQGWLLHAGDVSSGFFVLAIAAHTYHTTISGRTISTKTFWIVIACIWIFALFLSVFGAGLHGQRYFVRAGAWCWVSEAYQDARLGLHYIWIFAVQASLLAFYVTITITLRRKLPLLDEHSRRRVKRVTQLMILYPCIYILLTLPLSIGRMWSMAHSGRPVNEAYACFAGAMITSSGWADSLLYSLTRKRLLRERSPLPPVAALQSADDKTPLSIIEPLDSSTESGRFRALEEDSDTIPHPK